MKSNELKSLIRAALAEDIGRGDVTSKAIIPSGKKAKAKIIAKEKGIPISEVRYALGIVKLMKDVFAEKIAK